ncbi:hypothetical protein [Methylopila sp. 73B]|uniref:hypothetical protein n=1 Tax=Methylopila sp. 73B TaxID=1120792 RepID=UPI000362ED17|nr:hypothetical protein [Methylopila sp. 73B]
MTHVTPPRRSPPEIADSVSRFAPTTYAPPFGPFSPGEPMVETDADRRIVHAALLLIAFSLGAVAGWVAFLSKIVLGGAL